MFDEVVKTDRWRRRVLRAGFVAGSTAAQVVGGLVLIALIAAMTRSAPPEPPPSVEVKFVKGGPRPAPLALPPAPPPAPRPPPPRAAPRPAPVAAIAAATPMIQPSAVPEAMPAPGPPEPPAPEPTAGEPGVIGGASGGHLGAVAASGEPPARPAFDASSMARPVFVAGPDPTYTRAALDREVEGTMVVACVVTREGLVRDCVVRRGLPFMDEAVVQALQRRRYRPATLRGEPIEVLYEFRLALRLPR